MWNNTQSQQHFLLSASSSSSMYKTGFTGNVGTILELFTGNVVGMMVGSFEQVVWTSEVAYY